MENFERVGSETGNDRQLLLVAVVVSLLLHLFLLVTLFNYGSLGSDEAPPAAISVSFVTSNPFDVIPTQPDEVQEPVPENVPPAGVAARVMVFPFTQTSVGLLKVKTGKS